jgi:rare lipoprotein A (peptidoglycan hydrolase)
MPRLPRTTLLLYAVLALCLAAPAASALAETGGSSAAPSAPARLPAKVLATWFGPGFYGQMTACGQLLTPATVGVASRTLPCGTLLRVSYRHRRLVAPVIDRGPYAHNGATFDLTASVAQTLGIDGSARIGARVVGTTANVPSLGEPPAPAPGSAAATATLAGGAVAAPAG